MPSSFTPTILNIAGSDPYWGAGIQVDSKAIHAFWGHAFSVTTALTAQNSTGVIDVLPIPAEHVKIQLLVSNSNIIHKMIQEKSPLFK